MKLKSGLSVSSSHQKSKLICVVGPTASGKSDLAVKVAQAIDGEIINGDSRQFYTELNKATAKPSREHQSIVKHHLVDCASIEEPWNVVGFVKEAKAIIEDVISRGKQPILVGGTGLYVKAVLFGLDDIPAVGDQIKLDLEQSLQKHGLAFLYDELKSVDAESAKRLEANDMQRIVRALGVFRTTGNPIHSYWSQNQDSSYEYVKLALDFERDVLYDRINKRVELMFDDGLMNEAKNLFKAYPDNLVLQKTIGYREWFKLGFEDADQVSLEIQKNTRHFAKRQLTWFKNESDVKWCLPADEPKVLKAVQYFCNR